MKTKIIIPVLVYLAVTLAGFAFHTWRHHRIEAIYEEARINGLPVVVSHYGDRAYLNWRIHSMYGETVGLSPDNDWPFPGFTASNGSTVLYLDLILTRPNNYYYEFTVPEDVPGIVYQHTRRDPFRLSEMTGSTGINLPWRIYGDGERASMINDLSGETVPLPLQSKAPWEEPYQNFEMDRFDTWFSGEAGMLFIQIYQGVWRYDIANDEWLKLSDITTSHFHYIVSQDGTIAAVVSKDRDQNFRVTSINTDFIDTRSGEVIRSIPDVNCLGMGNRWAACLNYPVNADQFDITIDPLVFTIYDLENEQISCELILNDHICLFAPLSSAFELLIIEPE